MGDINFVDNPQNKKTSAGKRSDSQPELKWSDPAQDGLQSAPGPDNEVSGKIGTVRHESAVVDTNTEPALPPENKKAKFGFVDFVVSLFGKKEGPANGTFMNEKKALAEQGMDIKKEKTRRTDTGAKKAATETEAADIGRKRSENRFKYSEVKKLSISEAIKMKLKFDSLGKGGNTIKTNLIKDEITTYVDWRKNGTDLLMNVVVSVIILGIAYGALMYREHRAIMQEQGIDKQIETLTGQLDEAMKDVSEIDLFQKRLTLVTDILKDHIYWTNFFSFLERTILDEVTYNGVFGGNTEGRYSFAATADSFQTVENQVRVLRDNQLVKSASVDSASYNPKDEGQGVNIPDVSFTITMEIDKELFNMDKETFKQYFSN